MVALLKDQSIDFDALFADLLRWHAPGKRIQNQWARQFYRTLQRHRICSKNPKPTEGRRMKTPSSKSTCCKTFAPPT